MKTRRQRKIGEMRSIGSFLILTMVSFLWTIPDAAVAQQKEIVAAASSDKFGQMAGDEGGGVGAAARDNVLGRLGAAADQRTGVVTGLEVEAVIYPLLLDEFELSEQAGADRHEDHAPAAVGIDVGQAAPQDAAPVGQRRGSLGLAEQGVKHVARIGAADMGAERTF